MHSTPGKLHRCFLLLKRLAAGVWIHWHVFVWQDDNNQDNLSGISAVSLRQRTKSERITTAQWFVKETVTVACLHVFDEAQNLLAFAAKHWLCSKPRAVFVGNNFCQPKPQKSTASGESCRIDFDFSYYFKSQSPWFVKMTKTQKWKSFFHTLGIVHKILKIQ